MKTPLAFLAGAGVGALAMWLAMPKASQPAAESAGRQTAGHESRQGGAPASELEALPSKTRRPASAAEKADDEGATVLDESNMKPAEMRQILQAMAKEAAEKKTRRLDERMATLKSRLNLDDATAAKVRALLENSAEEEDRVVEAAGGLVWTDPADSGKPALNRAAMDESILKLLAPEQAVAYKEFAAEQKENRIEVVTAREMTRLQENLTLTPGQKDKVYQALNEIAAREEQDAKQSADLDPAELKARRQVRLDALRPLLTPEQFAIASRQVLVGFPDADEAREPDGKE